MLILYAPGAAWLKAFACPKHTYTPIPVVNKWIRQLKNVKQRGTESVRARERRLRTQFFEGIAVVPRYAKEWKIKQ